MVEPSGVAVIAPSPDVTGVPVAVRMAAGVEVLELVPELSRIYEAAFSESPYFETAGHARRFANRLRQRTSAAGFRCALAWGTEEHNLIGFALGMTADPLLDPPLYATLIDSVGPWVAAHWLLGQFTLTELAVLPSWQRCGVGGLLHDGVLGTATHRAAWLLAHPLAPARGFYQARGWRELGRYDTGCRVLMVMGRLLSVVMPQPPGPRRHARR